MKGGGRGYYRNISLLSAWAHAPFMHNNAIGPEICGKPADAALDFYSSPYVDADGEPLADPPDCWAFDPSVEGRYALYKASMAELLNPDARVPKMFVLDRDIVIDIAPAVALLGRDLGLTLTIPAGFPAVDVNSLRYKDLIQDLVLVGGDPAKFEAKYATLLTAAQRAGAARRAPGDPRGADRDRVAVGDRAGARARGGGGRAGAGPDAAGRQRLRAALLFERARATSRTPGTRSARASARGQGRR